MIKRIIALVFVIFALSGCTSVGDSNKDFGGLEHSGGSDDGFDIPIKVKDSEIVGEYSIQLRSPQENQVLKSPFLVGGEANLPSDIVYVRVKKPNGEVVISEQARIKKESQEASVFGILINFAFQSTDKGIVEVYGIDSTTGDEIASQSIPVNFDTISGGNIYNNPAQ